jgi:DNA-binding CsgD family transcriptional regulator
MRKYTRVRQLTAEEQATLVKGAKSTAGFTVRRSQILLLSANGQTPQQIAHQLHCGDQTVRKVIRAFEREGLACLQAKSRRPHHDPSTFDAHSLQQLYQFHWRIACKLVSPKTWGNVYNLNGTKPPTNSSCFTAGNAIRIAKYVYKAYGICAAARACKQLLT